MFSGNIIPLLFCSLRTEDKEGLTAGQKEVQMYLCISNPDKSLFKESERICCQKRRLFLSKRKPEEALVPTVPGEARSQQHNGKGKE
jgi:hypothetical protein